MSYVVMSVVFVVVLSLLSLGAKIVDSIEEESLRVENEIATARACRTSLAGRVEEVRRYRHDADSLVRAVEQAMLDEGARGGEGGVPADGGATGGFALAWATIEMHRRLCAEAVIPFDCEVDGRFEHEADACGITEAELCIVLQNLLDNAYEASLAISSDESRFGRCVGLRMRQVAGGGLHIEVRNRVATPDAPSMNTSKASPEFHGVGLQAVADIAKEHGGSVESEFDAAERLFTMVVELHGGRPALA